MGRNKLLHIHIKEKNRKLKAKSVWRLSGNIVINRQSGGISLRAFTLYSRTTLASFLSKPTEPPNGNLTRFFLPRGLRHYRCSLFALIGDGRRFLRRWQTPLRSGWIQVQRLHRWMLSRRRWQWFRLRNGVRDGLWDQSPNSSVFSLPELWRFEKEQRSLLSPRCFLLQLPAWRSGQSLQTRLQRHYSLPELISHQNLFWI